MTARRFRWPVVADWRDAWRWASARVAAAAVAFGSAPVEAQAFVLTLLHVQPARIPAVLGLALIAARLFDVSAPRLVVADWRDAPRWLSVQVGVVGVAWGSMPMEWQQGLAAWVLSAAGAPESLAPAVVSRVPAVLGALALAGRLTSQRLQQETTR